MQTNKMNNKIAHMHMVFCVSKMCLRRSIFYKLSYVIAVFAFQVSTSEIIPTSNTVSVCSSKIVFLMELNGFD